MLSLRLLGTPLITLDGEPLSISRRKSRALLFYLAAHAAPATRDQVLALFWPDHDRAAAQQTLRTTLHGLRKELGPALVVSDDTLALAPDADVDTRRFEAYLTTTATDLATLASTIALYRGEFLAGFSLPDAEEFSEWVDATRERYRQLALRGMVALAQLLEERHDYAGALEVLTRALTLNPLQEDIQRNAMRLEYLAGDRAGAIRRFEQLRRLLDDELGVPPMEETRELYDAIITDNLPNESRRPTTDDRRPTITDARSAPLGVETGSAVGGQSSSILPFIGRDAELQRLREAALAHRLALIEGEPGIGKTRLADAFIESFGGLALVGTARELEQALPYQPVIEALRGLMRHPAWPALHSALALPAVWRGEIARLVPELIESAGPSLPVAPLPGGNESRLWEALNQLLLALAQRHPVVLLLDDLHWADASTLAVLGYLVRQSSSAPISFLATARPVEPRSPLAALVQTLTREGRLTRLPLTRLKGDDLVALAHDLSPGYTYPLAEWLTRNTEGNPYMLAELVRYAREQHILNPNGVVNLSALSDSPVVPGAVYSLIQSRLARLSDTARRVLDVAVAIGREFDLPLVTRTAGLSEQAILDALDELRANGLIVPLDGMRYGFDHTLTMEVAYREVGEARHRVIHRQLGEALEQLHHDQPGALAGLIASHFAEGNAPERAAHFALLAARRAADLAAWSEAIGFYQQALAGADDARKIAIYMGLGDAYGQLGSYAPAAEAYRAALGLAESHGDRVAADQARLQLAPMLMSQGRFAEAIALAQQVLKGGTPELMGRAELMWGTILSVEGVDLAGAAQHLQTAATFEAAQSDPASLAQINFELGSIAAQRGDLATAVSFYRRALATAEGHPSAINYVSLAHNNLAYHLMLLGDASARHHAEAGLRIARETGVLGFQAYLLSTLGEIALAQGDLDTAERSFTEGLDMSERLAIPERIAGLTANLGLVAVQRGQTPLAIHRLSSALARADAIGTRHLAAQIRIWLAPLLPPSEARDLLAEARAIAESGGRQRLLDDIARVEAAI
jgi:DNA-binding SARP family transcriptional activator/predicted ATPase